MDLHHGHGVVVKDGGDIFRRELVGCVRDEQTGLSHSTVPNHDTPGQRNGVSQRRGGAGGGGRPRQGGGERGEISRGAYLIVATTILSLTRRQEGEFGG